jgi:hypothetical protein
VLGFLKLGYLLCKILDLGPELLLGAEKEMTA